MWSELRSFWRNVFRREAADRELSDELDAYVELLTAEKVSAGFDPVSARRAALLEVGGVEQVKEAVRAERIGALVDMLVRDIRFGVRELVRAPLLSAIVVLTLAVSMGANTAVFSFAHALLMQRLPYAEPDRLVAIGDPPLRMSESFGFALSRSVNESGAVTSAALYYLGSGANLEARDGARRVTVTQVDPSFMRTLGVAPVVGRDFQDTEGVAGANRVALLSYRLWRGLGGARSVLGSELQLSGMAYTVVGIMPRALDFPAGSDVWIPTPTRAELFGAALAPSAIARLRTGVTLTEAERRLNEAHVELRGARDPDQRPITLVGLQQQLTQPIRLPILLLFGAVALVLLIGCANVAALLLARVSAREGEFAVRGMLGASGSRIAGQMLTESFVLALIGAALGLWLARVGLSGLVAMFPADVMPAEPIRLSRTALAYTGGVSVLTAVLIACAPALRAARVGRSTAQTRTATYDRRHQTFRTALLTGEIALGVVLVLGAGLLTRSLMKLRSIPLGFDPASVVTLQVRLPSSRYDEGAQSRYSASVLERVRAMPGVRAAGWSTRLPLSHDLGVGYWVESVETREVADPPRIIASYGGATPGFIEALGATVLHGRSFNEHDGTPGQMAYIISETLARQLFNTTAAVGRRIKVRQLKPEGVVVGVISDLRLNSPMEDARGALLEPLAQAPAPYLSLVVRTSGSAAPLIDRLQDILRDIDRDVPPYHIRKMDTLVASSLGARHTLPHIVSLFAGVALVLCALGTYGLAAELVTEQRRALCIRMALGAQRAAVVRLVLRHGLLAGGAGTALGLLAGLALTRVLRALLFEIDSLDPLTFASVPLVILAVTAAASALPAVRAARLDPAIMLRE